MRFLKKVDQEKKKLCLINYKIKFWAKEKMKWKMMKAMMMEMNKKIWLMKK